MLSETMIGQTTCTLLPTNKYYYIYLIENKSIYAQAHIILTPVFCFTYTLPLDSILFGFCHGKLQEVKRNWKINDLGRLTISSEQAPCQTPQIGELQDRPAACNNLAAGLSSVGLSTYRYDLSLESHQYLIF